MSSVLCFREFVNERLTAAAEEILVVFEKTVVVYEEELSRQRRLLDIVLRPEIKLNKKDISQLPVCNEAAPLDHQKLCNQERNTGLVQNDTGALQIINDQNAFCQEGEQFVLKPQGDLFQFGATCEGSEQRNHQTLHLETEIAAEKQPLNNISDMAIRPQSDREAAGVSDPNGDYYNSHSSHRNKSQSHERGNEESASTHQEPGNKYFKCQYCAEEFYDFMKLKIHTRSHTGEKPFKCDTCGKGFNQKSLMTKHMTTHTGLTPFICGLCGQEFSCQSNLVTHMKTHNVEKPHTCVTCGKGFSRSADLKRHIRTHTGEKPYSCIHCGKEFPYHSSLTNHVRVHTGERPYKCMWCGKRFAVSTTLKIHTRVHTGEKPYECNICGRNFAHNTGLRLHRKIHTSWAST